MEPPSPGDTAWLMTLHPWGTPSPWGQCLTRYPPHGALSPGDCPAHCPSESTPSHGDAGLFPTPWTPQGHAHSPPYRAPHSPGDTGQPTPHLMVWLMMMGSGCCRSPASFMGISEKRMRTQLKIWGAKQSLWHPWQGPPHLGSQVGHPQAGGASQSPGKGHNQRLEGLWELGRGFSAGRSGNVQVPVGSSGCS